MQNDPRNRLLARQSRLRLEAEIIRDVWLSAGGLLSDRKGGPSVFPRQPDGVLTNRATQAEWMPSRGEDQYRRGLYTWVWRLTPYPQLPLFNAPDGVTACSRRDRSNVPVQALTLLNDPTFLECAQHLALRVLLCECDDLLHLDVVPEDDADHRLVCPDGDLHDRIPGVGGDVVSQHLGLQLLVDLGGVGFPYWPPLLLVHDARSLAKSSSGSLA